MLINLNQPFRNADDSLAFDGTQPIILKNILISSLLHPNVVEGEKIQRYNLYRDIVKTKNDLIQLKAEDIAFLKRVVLAAQSTLVVGQAHEMLETPFIESALLSGAPTAEDLAKQDYNL